MKTLHLYAITALSLMLGTGCKTTENAGRETVIPKHKQNAYLSKAAPPQQYGYQVYGTQDGGIAHHGSGRLHPRHMASADFIVGNVPVIEVRGNVARKRMNALLDVSSPSSWMEFKTAQEFRATFLGWNDQVIPYRGVYNTDGVDAYAGVVGQLRIKQLFMENMPFYIRMAHGSLGPLARGIRMPEVDAMMGWDQLRLFEYIQIDLQNGRAFFSATIPYTPNEKYLMASPRIINLANYGLAVHGAIVGEPVPILLDFAGDYHFARGDKRVGITKQASIGDIVYRQLPTLMLPAHNSPPRAGRQMLEPYIITICPGKGVVYFERRLNAE
jgi:hypothetical protein